MAKHEHDPAGDVPERDEEERRVAGSLAERESIEHEIRRFLSTQAGRALLVREVLAELAFDSKSSTRLANLLEARAREEVVEPAPADALRDLASQFARLTQTARDRKNPQ